MTTVLAALPDATQAKAAQALAEAFPDAKLQSIVPLRGGLSGAVLYKATVDERPVVLRIIEGSNPFNNPLRQFTCMLLAAAHNIAPQVYYVNVELGVSISAYVEHQPVIPLLQHDTHLIAKCGEVLRRLHSGPPFPVFPTVFELIQGGWEHMVRLGVILPPLIHELMAAFEVVKSALQGHLTSTPCHNDLNPGNVLYDGKQVWLVDWEGAAMGDPMFDVASLLHWFVLDSQQEATLLEAYFQHIPTEHEVAKLTLMKQVSWCFYGLVFLLLSLEGDGPHEVVSIAPEQLPSFTESIRAVSIGELRLQDADGRRRLGLVIAKQSLDEMSRPAFDHALTYLKTK